VHGEGRNGKRAQDARLLVAVATLPLLVSCSSSSSVEYATDAYPSQSLVDLLKESKNPPPPAVSAASPPPAATTAAVPTPAPTTPPAREPPPGPAATAANPPPAATTPAENDDAVAAAFPSVSLVDILTGRKPGGQ